MNHRDEFLRLIEADLDREISADDRARLETALREDPALAAEAAELRRLRAVFRAVPATTAPDGFTADVLGATVGVDATARERRSGFRVMRAAPWIAGLAAAGLLAVMLGPWADNGGRFALRDAPTETAGAPDHESWGDDGEMLGRSPATDRQDGTPAKRGVAPISEPVPVVILADSREAGDKLVADSESVGRKRRAGRGASLRKAGEEPPAPEAAEPDPSDAPVAPPVRAPATATATAPAAAGLGGGGGGSKSDGVRGTPDPQPVKPSAPRPNAPAKPAEDGTAVAEGRSAEDVPALGDHAESMGDLLRKATEASPKPSARRYVVFEDEGAARRFVSSLRALAAAGAPAEEKVEVEAGRGDDAGAKKADAKESDGPVADGGVERDRDSKDRGQDALREDAEVAGSDAGGGPTTGGGAGPSSAGSSLASRTSVVGPRVLDRMAFATSDPAVGRVFARAPAGGVFGEDVPAELLQAAEVRFRLVAGERRGSQSAPGAEPGAVAESAGANESEPPAADEEPPDATRAEAPRPASSGKSKNVGARVEIVVVVVPQGSLPAGTRLGDD